MRTKVHVSSLSVGRCFTPAVEPGASAEEPSAEQARISKPVLGPENAWKVTAVEDDGVAAQSAAGTSETFPPTTEVVEIPRQGYDRLVEQAG
jgi:hypothetical protein